MQFLLLIHGDPAQQPAPGSSEAQAEFAAYGAVTQRLAATGALRDSQVLLPPQTAVTVSVRDGDPTHEAGPATAGPVALGGYYLVDVADHDEALGWAAEIPGAATGRVEVRPVLDLAGAGVPS